MSKGSFTLHLKSKGIFLLGAVGSFLAIWKKRKEMLWDLEGKFHHRYILTFFSHKQDILCWSPLSSALYTYF